MIAELLLVLVGHESRLFDSQTGSVCPELIPLFHPGEKETLEWLSSVARRYKDLRAACEALMKEESPYINVFCQSLLSILTEQYEDSIVQLERKALKGDSDVASGGPAVALSVIRVAISDWETPLSMLKLLVARISSQKWNAGPFIDLLVETTNSSVAKSQTIMQILLSSVLNFWKRQVSAFVLRGSLSQEDPIATGDFVVQDRCMPSFVTQSSRQSISYIGRAIATVNGSRDFAHPPLDLIDKHAVKINAIEAYSQDFDSCLADLRHDISDWLWHNVLITENLLETLNSM
jgi:gamma-tubulin complex component 4